MHCGISRLSHSVWVPALGYVLYSTEYSTPGCNYWVMGFTRTQYSVSQGQTCADDFDNWITLLESRWVANRDHCRAWLFWKSKYATYCMPTQNMHYQDLHVKVQVQTLCIELAHKGPLLFGTLSTWHVVDMDHRSSNAFSTIRTLRDLSEIDGP